MRTCLIYIYIHIEKEIFICLSVGGKEEGWKRKVEVNWMYVVLRVFGRMYGVKKCTCNANKG